MRANASARRRAGIVWAAVLALGIAATDVAAQEVAPEARAELEAKFQEILADPTNLDLTYEYARMATAAGDFEAAITAYERLLLFNPDLPRVKAELGVLYFQLGSFDTARSYLTEALEAEDIPEQARERIESFLARIEETDTRHRFAGSVSFGARYQTNANFGPDGEVLVNGVALQPGADTEADEDFNLFVSLTGRYVYDFGNDAGDFFAVEAALYGARQFKFTELDVEHLQVKAGPGFRLYPKESGPVVLRPQARFTYVRLNDDSYNVSPGFGLDLDWQAFDDTSLFMKAFADGREYFDTDDRQNSDSQDGSATRFTFGATHRLEEDMTLRGEAFLGSITGAQDFETYTEVGFAARLNMRVNSPFEGSEDMELLAAPWSISLGARYTSRDYEGPNLIITPETRDDDDIRIDGTLAVPLESGWSVFGTASYQNNQSNIPNNEFDNFSLALGANLRF